MSAINVFALENVFVFPRIRCDCVCQVEETAIVPLFTPVVSRKWAVQISNDGTRRLVAHWFKNEKTL